ncbi:MAG: putative bifunctional diguanylate cyclase/phosphodiesterase [Sandaracinaceae bacterium]
MVRAVASGGDSSPVDAAPARRPRVLVIEDSADVLRAVVRCLGLLEVDVLGAETGEEGLELVREQPADLVLTDVNMPGMDGFEVLEAVRQDPRTATIPVVIMTAQDDRASVRRGMALGADDYLTKPFTGAEVRETVRARLDHHSRLNEVYTRRLERTREAYEAAIQRDADTKLPNQRAFEARLRRGAREASGAVLMVDIDRFDRLQSALSPGQSDVLGLVVRATAERLARAASDATGRAVELFRLDTSRFAAVAEGVDGTEDALAVAEALVGAARPALSGGHLELRLSVTVGVAQWPGHGSGSALSRIASRASIAAAEGRQSGGNVVSLFDPNLHDQALSRVVLESSLHRALERDQLEVLYQPQVAATERRVRGMEALLRWRHPELGTISPFHFIPVAEETRLILEIGPWVLRAACRQAAAWSSALGRARVGVNISALQLEDGRLVDTVLGALDASGLAPQQLTLELTESLMVRATERAVRDLRSLVEHGIGLAIDDFGTGYSTLKTLHALPVTELKIDRSFIRQVHDDRSSASIVGAVIDMAHRLGLRTVAEGVEEEAQLAFLQERSCDEIQGDLISKPRPADGLVGWAEAYASAE